MIKVHYNTTAFLHFQFSSLCNQPVPFKMFQTVQLTVRLSVIVPSHSPSPPPQKRTHFQISIMNVEVTVAGALARRF
jgi:hypothetical protein